MHFSIIKAHASFLQLNFQNALPSGSPKVIEMVYRYHIGDFLSEQAISCVDNSSSKIVVAYQLALLNLRRDSNQYFFRITVSLGLAVLIEALKGSWWEELYNDRIKYNNLGIGRIILNLSSELCKELKCYFFKANDHINKDNMCYSHDRPFPLLSSEESCPSS